MILFLFFGGLNGVAEKADMKMEQLRKTIHSKVMYINWNRELEKRKC